MKLAGGIIAIVAGIFAVVAAGITLFIGGIGSVAHADSASTVVGLGWGGVVFSFLVIILGAVTLSTQSKVPGILLMIASLFGAVLGGTLVAIFMVLSFIGGLLALFGKRPTAIAVQS